MWILLILVILGFGAGFFFNLPIYKLDPKYLALVFMGILDSFTYGLARDVSGLKNGSGPILIRLVLGLLIGGIIIYFGEKSQLDLYLVALVPLGVGFALNMYKFLPK